MAAKVDGAILRALSLDASNAKLVQHGGSGFASSFRLTTPETCVFVKTSSSSGAEVMFKGEHASLNAIHYVVPSLCPRSFAWGKLDANAGGYFLATEFLDMSVGGGGGGFNRSGKKSNTNSDSGSGLSLAQKLAKLHSTPAPTPEGHDRPQFGFPVVTCCGDTPQPNDYTASWAEFFAEKRLMAILNRAEKNNGKDSELRKVVEQVAHKVVPRLLGEGHLGGTEGIQPVVTHGDLWSGNKGKGSFVGRNQANPEEADAVVEDVVFDPSATYAHSEYDHGIMNMFGGFGSSFWKEYFAIIPETEPVDEYVDRVALYESYHHLNHYAIFGGGYKGGALSLLKRLIRKYGT